MTLNQNIASQVYIVLWLSSQITRWYWLQCLGYLWSHWLYPVLWFTQPWGLQEMRWAGLYQGTLRCGASVPPYGIPIKLGEKIMWLAFRHPEQIRSHHSKPGYNWIKGTEQVELILTSGEHTLCQHKQFTQVPQLFAQIQMLLGLEVLVKERFPKSSLPPIRQRQDFGTWD